MSSLPGVPSLPDRQSSPDSNREYHRDVLHQQARRSLLSVLCQEALRLWDFCVQNAIHIIALHLPGVRNALVDLLSRVLFISPQMVITLRGCQHDLPEVGDSPNGPVRSQTEQEVSPVLLDLWAHQRLPVQCRLDPLE